MVTIAANYSTWPTLVNNQQLAKVVVFLHASCQCQASGTLQPILGKLTIISVQRLNRLLGTPWRWPVTRDGPITNWIRFVLSDSFSTVFHGKKGLLTKRAMLLQASVSFSNSTQLLTNCMYRFFTSSYGGRRHNVSCRTNVPALSITYASQRLTCVTRVTDTLAHQAIDSSALTTRHVHTLNLCFPTSPQGFALYTFPYPDFHRNICSACTVTVVLFGHFDRSLYVHQCQCQCQM